jgi:hypothetical protein
MSDDPYTAEDVQNDTLDAILDVLIEIRDILKGDTDETN